MKNEFLSWIKANNGVLSIDEFIAEYNGMFLEDIQRYLKELEDEGHITTNKTKLFIPGHWITRTHYIAK